ncbi:hypothetical protein PR048_020699 [Dryococelus australis]|uniref:Uncharacterized protein n=1 Tax=Dryococelus australis TaxID=614101 RepID=A0ABQ9H724_9NEOP|nr:hypothetical protein PR048_020699 [Dryococelus australis]
MLVSMNIPVENKRAFFIPCTSHALNLVVNDAAMASSIGVAFLTIQKAILKKHVTSLTLKPLSDTRWEARIDTIRPLRYYINDLYEALIDMLDDSSFDRKARHEAESLTKKFMEFKSLYCLVVWHYILNERNVSSKVFQTVELATAVTALETVTNHLKSLRNDDSFNSFLVDAIMVAENIGAQPKLQTDYPCIRPRRPMKQFNDSNPDEAVILEPKTDFKVDACSSLWISG